MNDDSRSGASQLRLIQKEGLKMTRLDLFNKTETGYEKIYSCTDASKVLTSLAHDLTSRYLYNKKTTITRIVRSRCNLCGSFDEITIYRKLPNGDRTKAVYIVPIS